jgi:hypothetical protein
MVYLIITLLINPYIFMKELPHYSRLAREKYYTLERIHALIDELSISESFYYWQWRQLAKSHLNKDIKKLVETEKKLEEITWKLCDLNIHYYSMLGYCEE